MCVVGGVVTEEGKEHEELLSRHWCPSWLKGRSQGTKKNSTGKTGGSGQRYARNGDNGGIWITDNEKV